MNSLNKKFFEGVINRRSIYGLSNKSPIGDEELKEIIEVAVKNVPSAFNSQTTRVVLLLDERHTQFWNMLKDNLRKIVPADKFGATENKINGSFLSGYGTVLFFEETEIVKGLQEQFPTYKNNFPVWSEQTNAMHQFTIWTALENEGLGCSLQHYAEVIEEDIKKELAIKSSWKLIAQMPFGIPTLKPDTKTFMPLEERVKIYK